MSQRRTRSAIDAAPAPDVVAVAPEEISKASERSKVLGVPTIIPKVLLSALIAVYWLPIYLSGAAIPNGVKLVYAGAVAGVISRTCCAPLEMVSTLMMCRGDECQSMWAELVGTWEREGIKGLFKGNGANCLKVAPSRGTQFLVYEFVKKQLVIAGIGMAAVGMPLNAGARLFAGGIAGMVAAAIVYPLEVIKTVLTVYPDECEGGIGDALNCVVRYGGGLRSLYAGLLPTLVAMFPYVGVEFMVYETLKRRWEMHIGVAAGTLALLALGALAGCAGQATAHPLDVVRRRMQLQGMLKKKSQDSDSKPKNAPVDNMFAGLYSIYKHEGAHVLFKGLGPACLEKAPSTAIGYFIYEGMKTVLNVASV